LIGQPLVFARCALIGGILWRFEFREVSRL